MSSPYILGVLLDDRDSDAEEELSCLGQRLGDLCRQFLFERAGLYSSGFGIHRRPNGETIGYPEQKELLEVMDWLRRDAVSSGRYSRS